MGWESFGVVRFDLGPLLQGQTRIAKLKSHRKKPVNVPGHRLIKIHGIRTDEISNTTIICEFIIQTKVHASRTQTHKK